MTSDPNAAPALEPTGQASAAPTAAGTTAPAPGATTGQGTVQGSPTAGQAASPAPAAAVSEPSFFDPKDLDPALQPAYKQMQATFTRKMQELGNFRDKATAYDRFQTDKDFQIQVIQETAKAHGYSLTRAQAAAAADAQAGPEDWDTNPPASWKTVVDTVEKRTRESVLRELAPILGNVRDLQTKSVEQQLASIDPEWKTYEPTMRDILRQHPSLSGDIGTLYNMALVRDGVFEARAVKQAQDRLRSSADAARVGGRSTTTSQPAPKNIGNFDDAVEEARRQLASGAKK